MKSDPWSYPDMLADIQAGRRFAFVRYSDGDWNCIFNRRGSIGDEHAYRPDLGSALKDAIQSGPDYHLGLMPSMMTPGRWWASDWTIIYVAARPDLRWCSSMILHNASMAGELGLFFEALRGWPITVISHAGMAGMRPWLGDFEHVVIPESNCWEARAEIEPRIIEACRAPGLALFSCSMPAKVWIRQAWEARGQASLIDVGSAFDPYIGRESRGYMRGGRVTLAPPMG